jgi:predicted HD superfamily hydrolase involved in NAD metabolism
LTLDQIEAKLERELTPKRFIHSINVMNSSVMLAKKYCEDVRKAELAGLLHDCARNIKGTEIFNLCEKFSIEVDEISRKKPELLHGPIGAKLAETEYSVTDTTILDAICNHTLGRENMSKLEKIVFLADYIEPAREFSGVEEIRKMAELSMDKAILLAYDYTLQYCLRKDSLVHPKAIYARNYILNKLQK